MRYHPDLSTESPYFAEKASDHLHMPIQALERSPGEKTCPITALYRTFRESMVSQHPIRRPLAVEQGMAELIPMRGGTRERHCFQAGSTAGYTQSALGGFLFIRRRLMCITLDTWREVIAVAPKATMRSDLLTQSCHSAMRKDRESDEEAGGN